MKNPEVTLPKVSFLVHEKYTPRTLAGDFALSSDSIDLLLSFSGGNTSLFPPSFHHQTCGRGGVLRARHWYPDVYLSLEA